MVSTNGVSNTVMVHGEWINGDVDVGYGCAARMKRVSYWSSTATLRMLMRRKTVSVTINGGDPCV